MRTLLDALRDNARHSDKGITFVRSDGREQTLCYRDVWIETQRRAAWLRRHRIGKGDRVVLTLPEAEDFVLNFFGVIAAGAVPVPLYPPATLARLDAYYANLARVIAASEAKLLITSHRRAAQDGVPAPLAEVPTMRPEELAAAPAEEVTTEIRPDDLAFLQFTSGSTSLPKGVMVSHKNLAANAQAIMFDGLAADPERDKGVSWLPLYHDMGLIGFVIAPIFAQVPVVLMPTSSFVRRPSSWLDAIHRHRGTITFAPNFAFALSVQGISEKQMAGWDLSSLRALGCGAEPIDAPTVRAFLDKFEPVGLKKTAILPAYGLAEATLAVSFADLAEPLTTDIADPLELVRGRAVPAQNGHSMEIVSCGRPFPQHHVEIVDDDGHGLPERNVGEIVVEGPSLATGYFGDESATRAAFRQGRLFTGDLGYLADGRLFVCGRKKDVIILRGRNYFPQDFERIISGLDGVRHAQVAVFTRPRAANGERLSTEELLVAVAEVQNSQVEHGPLRKAVVSAVLEQTGLKVDEVHFLRRGALPKTSSGKVRRRETRAQLEAGTLATAMGNEE
ncbi:MAG TPA: fatty acyl-AMP ligase [Polyangiaceae bacterium]|jgi:fatty-acyl-CoA synthase